MLVPSRVRARDALETLRAHFRDAGSGQVAEVDRAFIAEGLAWSREQTLTEQGCRAYLAVGSSQIRDIDLGLYTLGGQPIAEDSGPSAYGYLRICGRAGLSFYVMAAVFAGQGELLVVRIDDPPASPGRLPVELSLSPSVGGKRVEQRPIGGDDRRAEELASALRREERALSDAGYIALGPPRIVQLRAGTALFEQWLSQGQCVKLAVRVPLSRGVALTLSEPSGAQRHGRSSGLDRAELSVCAGASGAHRLQIHARAMRGLAIARVFSHPGVRPDLVAQLEADGALAVAEAESSAAARGMELRALGRAWVERASPLVWPLSLRGGRCYVVFALPASGMSVELRLLDRRGVLLALHEGGRRLPSVLTCPEVDAALHLELRGLGGDGLAGIWLGEPASP